MYGYLENSGILEGIDLPILIISDTIDRYSQHKIDVDISHNSIVIKSLSVYGTDEGSFQYQFKLKKNVDYDVIAYNMNNLIGQTKFMLK